MANFNFNKVILGGRLTADAELKQTPSAVSVTSFSIAVNRKGKEAQTDFIDVVAWRQTGEFVSKHFSKGKMIVVSGRLQIRKWTDKDGNKRSTAEIVADNCYFGEKKDSDNTGFVPNNAVPNNYAVMDEPDDQLPF